jgi:iron complex transport system permease protein
MRPFVGSRPALLLPQCALGGALATLVADIACRLVPTLGELKLGIVTALLGAPYFLWLLTRERRLLA